MEIDVDAQIGVDVATKADIERMMRNRDPYIEKVFRPYSGLTDANGNLVLRVYDVEDGKAFSVGKIILWADGFTPASPYSNAAAWVGIFHGNQPSPANLADFAPYSPGGQIFPGTFEYGLLEAPEFKAPDNVTIGVFSGPPSTNITCLLFGELRSARIKARAVAVIKPEDRKPPSALARPLPKALR